MRIGIGLPTTTAGARGEDLLSWAREADDGPFHSLGVVDRMVYPSLESMSVLAACASVTERVRLVTMVVIGPLRQAATLAKQTLALDAVSGGRATLGVAVGARRDDYDALGVEHSMRGAALERLLASLRDSFDDERMGDGSHPELIVGGGSDVSLARAARHADGYVHGGGPPRAFERAADRMRTAWGEAGRPGRPRLWAQGYFVLGDDDKRERALNYMLDYYSFTGPFARRIAEGLLTTPQQVTAFARGYAEAGCDELVLLPAISDADQVARLSEAVAR